MEHEAKPVAAAPREEAGGVADRRPGRPPRQQWLLRFALAYTFLYMLPFPLTLLGMLYMIPGFGELPVLSSVVGYIVGVHSLVTQPVVLWMGRALFAVEAEVQGTGSGDMTWHYLDLLFDLLLALVVAAVWSSRRRGRPVSVRLRDGWQVMARYYLGSTLLSYGFAKVFPLQFPAPGPDRLLQPYGDSSPMGLLWTFMGASTGYQIFGGLMELAGGYLLFFRRTTLLGALVSAGVLANILALNVFYDVPVKLFSAHLLLVACLIALPDVPRLVRLFLHNRAVEAGDLTPRWHGSRLSRRWLLAVKWSIIASVTAVQVVGSIGLARSPGAFLAERSALRGVYAVESFAIVGAAEGVVPDVDEGVAGDELVATGDDEGSPGAAAEEAPVPDGLRWVRVGLNPPWVGTVQRADGSAVRLRLRLDEEQGTLALFDRGLAEPPHVPMVYERSDDGSLELRGLFDGHRLEVVLRPLEHEALLTSRGFRWVNEYPFNR